MHLTEQQRRLAAEMIADATLRLVSTIDVDDTSVDAARFAETSADDDDDSACRKIIAVMEAATAPMKRASVAREAHLTLTGGHFRAAFRQLRAEKRIFRPNPEIAAYWLQGKALPKSSKN